MKVEENVLIANLFDCYGGMLSECQKNILVSYLFYDITISEIAENLGITRQAVKDSINKAIKKLKATEEKLGLSERLQSLIKENESLKEKLSKED